MPKRGHGLTVKYAKATVYAQKGTWPNCKIRESYVPKRGKHLNKLWLKKFKIPLCANTNLVLRLKTEHVTAWYVCNPDAGLELEYVTLYTVHTVGIQVRKRIKITSFWLFLCVLKRQCHKVIILKFFLRYKLMRLQFSRD